MSTVRAEKAPQPSGNDVRWIISESQISALNLSIPVLLDNNRLNTTVEGDGVAMGIFALPPKEPSSSAFWAKILQKVHLSSDTNEKLSPTQLRIEPKIDLDDAQRGLHTPLSALHPYVIMEDGTRYGMAINVPKEWSGKWSESKERPEESNGFFTNYSNNEITEIYRQKNSVALLVRLNGDTPLAESQKDLGIKGLGPSRREMLIGVPESTDNSSSQLTALISHRHVLHPKNSPELDLGEKQTEKADVTDLEFHIVAERGTEENATFDNKGLIEVIVARCVVDEVIEKITKPRIVQDYPYDRRPGLLYSFHSEIDLGGLRSASTPDSTRKGETKFTNERREKVSIESVKNIKPVARFRLALVGSGGPITKSMAEATETTHQS
jgi:hypothetical protein